MKINSNFAIQSVCGENIVVSQGSLNQDMTQVISLNSTAVELWHQFEEKDFTLEQVAQYLVETYGIDQERAMSDASTWAQKLQGAKVIN